ncbi:MAG TPA: hypothetical protein VFO29_03170 [Candidatus Rubrimentiphilum sp.]|nr:hypothetical protein [Candidatus Rubrimentiphilum sp.]
MLRTLGGFVASAFLLLGCLIGQGRPALADQTYAESLYIAAVNATSSRAQPTFETYNLHSRSDGLAVRLTIQNHYVWLGIHSGDEPSSWQIRHRTDDYASEIIDADGTRYVTGRSFFDPTWYGTYRALRDGMLNYQDVEVPVSARETPAPAAASTMRQIAAVHVMGPTIYRLLDRGEQACPNGSPGHALHTEARDRAPQHQLSDVVINLKTNEFCMLRFGVRDAFGFHGLVEQHFDDVGGYWTLTDGIIDGTFRVFGISTHHGVWHYTLDDIHYPRSIPAYVFIVPPFQ